MDDRAYRLLPVKVPAVAHKGPHDTDGQIFWTAARNLEMGYEIGHGNVKSAIIALLRNVAAALGPGPTKQTAVVVEQQPDVLCALCLRQFFLDVEAERTSPIVVKAAVTTFRGTATCYMHLEDLYAGSPVAQVRGDAAYQAQFRGQA